MTTYTFSANGRKLLDAPPRGVPLYLHVRSGSTMDSGTVAVQYALVDTPVAGTDAHWETLEDLDALTAGKSRPIMWPGPLAIKLSGATAPTVYVDVFPGAAR